jgi:hypothetical protein
LSLYSDSANKTRDKNRIHTHKKTIRNLFERLENLLILESNPKKATNDADMLEYQFTELGKLVALLFEFDDGNTSNSTVDKIFTQTLNYYENQDYALARFCEIFFTNCYNKDIRLFKELIIPQLIQILKEPPNDIITVSNRFRNFQLFYKSKTLFKLLINSLNECYSNNPLVFYNVIYKFKIEIESLQEKYCKNLQGFEGLRFKNDSIYAVVLEGHCEICDKYIPKLFENMTEYFRSLIISEDRGVRLDCSECKSRDSLCFKLLSGFEDLNDQLLFKSHQVLRDKTNYYRDYSFREIFNKDKSGNTVVKSLYYQRIIQYFLKGVKEYHTLREVVKVIIKLLPLRTREKEENDLDIDEEWNEVVENREKTFRTYFSNLVSWQILSKRPTPMKTGPGNTDEYQITNFGHLLALLIDTEFNNNEKSFNTLYSYLESYFDDRIYSVYHFCKSYLKKCNDVHLFKVFIKYLKENILYKNNYIENDNDLFTSFIFMRTSDEKLNQRLWSLWYKAYTELDYGLQQLLLYHLKIAMERRIVETIPIYGAYEGFLLEFRNQYFTIPIEYQCINCNSNFIFLRQMPIINYLSMLFNGIFVREVDVSEIENQVKYIQCNECNEMKMKFTVI